PGKESHFSVFYAWGLLIELADPDIPKADRFAAVAVRLQLNGRSIVLLVERLADVPRLALQLEVILHQHSIEQHGDIGWGFQRTVAVESGRRPHHIVALPLPRLAA